MKYKVQFSGGWRGSWKFEARSDKRAWEVAIKYIDDHTYNYFGINVKTIHEIDEAGNETRLLPSYENCKKLPKRKSIYKNRIRKKAYKARYSDGKCSAPFLAVDDNAAKERANELRHDNSVYISGMDEIEYGPRIRLNKNGQEIKSTEWFYKFPITQKRKVDFEKLNNPGELF